MSCGTELGISTNDTISLLDSGLTVLSSVTIQDNCVFHGNIGAVPSTAGSPASHHFWNVNTNSGDVDFTPTTDGQLPALIANASDSDEFHFTNTGAGQLFFTSAEGYLYTFNAGEVLTIVRITGTNEYRLI